MAHSIGFRGLHTSSQLCRGRYYYILKKVTDPEKQVPNYFEGQAEKLPLDEKYLQKMQEIYYDKIGCTRELLFKREDNLIQHDSNYWLPKIDPNEPRLAYRKVRNLKNAPTAVKRIFSIGCGVRKDLTQAWTADIMDRVKRDELDESSLEAKIAKATAQIRQWTALRDQFATYREKKPGWLVNMLCLTIDRRRKLMKKLRETDYDSFERLLSQLKIAYHVPALPEDMPNETRKGWIEQQVLRRIEMEKEKKLKEYHDQLKKGRQATLDKIKTNLEKLEAEKAEILKRDEPIKTTEDEELNVVGKYQGHTIDCVSENQMHAHYYGMHKWN